MGYQQEEVSMSAVRTCRGNLAASRLGLSPWGMTLSLAIILTLGGPAWAAKKCPNGVIDSGEQCDGSIYAGFTGTPSCDAACGAGKVGTVSCKSNCKIYMLGVHRRRS